MQPENQFTVLKEIGNHSSEGLVIYSLVQRKVVYANEPAIHLIGLTEELSILNLDFILGKVVPEDKEHVKKKYHELKREALSAEVELTLASENSNANVVCVNVHLISDKSTIVAFIRDVTKAKKFEGRLKNFGGKKNTFIDSLTHHLGGALKLMQHLSIEAEKSIESQNDKNLRTYLSLVKDNCNHCLAVIDELLTVEQEGSTNASNPDKRIDIVEKIFSVYSELQQIYKSRSFTFNTTSPSIHVSTDELKLLQIFSNYTSNAIKFSDNSQAISISITHNENEVIVSVSDKGIGIADELKHLIFEQSAAVGRAGLKGEKSHGLGLSINKYLIEQMNGKVWFESQDGVGSTFFFSLPKH